MFLYANNLLAFFNILDLSVNNMVSVIKNNKAIGLRYHSQGKNILITNEFRSWATSGTSCDLSSKGNTRHNVVQAGSILSLVMAISTQALSTRSYFTFIFIFNF